MAFDDLGTGESMAQINVTPLVDVMLVLLVIFMVAAPILQQGVELQLPKETIAPLKGEESEEVVVSIDRKGLTYIGDGNLVEVAKLGERLSKILSGRDQKRVYIRADRRVEYGSVMAAMGSIRRAGILDVGLITEPGES